LNPIYQRNQEAPVHHKGEHTSDLIAKYTHELLEEAIGSNNPFFVAIAPIAPHSDIKVDRVSGSAMTIPIPAERHSHLFEGVKVPRTENFNPDSVSTAVPQGIRTGLEAQGTGLLGQLVLFMSKFLSYLLLYPKT
jgi:N-acetylglucosamine-6-sulfatase